MELCLDDFVVIRTAQICAQVISLHKFLNMFIIGPISMRFLDKDA